MLIIKLIDLIRLIWLILKLIINMLGLIFQILIIKLQSRHYLTPILITVLILLSFYNWQLWQHKKAGQLVVVESAKLGSQELRLELKQSELNQLEKNYSELLKLQPLSRDLLFNWGKIRQAQGQNAQKQFLKATELDPNF